MTDPLQLQIQQIRKQATHLYGRLVLCLYHNRQLTPLQRKTYRRYAKILVLDWYRRCLSVLNTTPSDSHRHQPFSIG